MALCRALAESGVRDLVLVSFLGSADVELLLGAGCVAELHSAGVGLEAAGLAPRYRAARERGEVRFVEWSEGALLAALEAASLGLDSALTRSGLGSDVPDRNPWLRVVPDPHTGAPVVAARALAPDLALLHVPGADPAGNLYVDGDCAADGLLARAARRTVATYERRVDPDPSAVAISRLWVDAAAPAPGGSAPTGCFPDRSTDLAAVRALAAGGR
jgi:glutaconate CoA-transferase subunit A